MESRQMVLMNLSAGQEERHRHREWACGRSGGRRGWDGLRAALAYTPSCVNWQLVGSCCIAQGAQLGAR